MNVVAVRIMDGHRCVFHRLSCVADRDGDTPRGTCILKVFMVAFTPD
jgi:hypothetical protein